MASEARAPIREADWSTKRSQHGMSGGLEGRSECPGDGVEQLRAASRATHVPVRSAQGAGISQADSSTRPSSVIRRIDPLTPNMPSISAAVGSSF